MLFCGYCVKDRKPEYILVHGILYIFLLQKANMTVMSSGLSVILFKLEHIPYL